MRFIDTRTIMHTCTHMHNNASYALMVVLVIVGVCLGWTTGVVTGYQVALRRFINRRWPLMRHGGWASHISLLKRSSGPDRTGGTVSLHKREPDE